MSNKIKRRKMKSVKIWYEGELYTFKGGYAKVPGCMYQNKPMMVSIKNFREMTKGELV